jgi:hypothetical protein
VPVVHVTREEMRPGGAGKRREQHRRARRPRRRVRASSDATRRESS